jgi:tetratricopeptide (TPR) repeat protein
LNLSAARGAEAKLTQKQVYRKLLQSVGQVLVRYPNGVGTGTAWVIDQNKRLMITNHHVVGTSETVMVRFPMYDAKGKVLTDPDDYGGKMPADGGKNAVKGTVLDSDPTRDLAVIRLESIPRGVVEVPLAADSPESGDRLHSIGGSPRGSAGLWVYTRGEVRTVARYRGRYENGQYVNFKAVQSTSPVNPGDSGGPIANDEGKLVAVVSSGDPNARLVSSNIDVSVVKDFLAEVRTLMTPGTAPASAFHARGLRYLEKNQFNKALGDFTQALKRDGKRADSYCGRARTFLGKNDKDTALADLNEALKLNPKYAEAYHVRGRVYAAKQQLDQAIADMTEAIRLNPKSPVFYYHRGLVYRAKGNSFLGEAISNYSSALRNFPGYLEAYKRRAECYAAQKEYQKAYEDYLAVLKRYPGDSESYFKVAEIYLNVKNYDKVIQFCNLALKNNYPARGLTYKLRGVANTGNKNYDKALADFTEAVELNRKDAEAYFFRGRVYEIQGKPVDAHKNYTWAVQFNPSYDKMAPLHQRRHFCILNKGGQTVTVTLRY